MAFNVSSTGNVQEVSFGPGNLFVGAVGATPTVDIGYVREGAQMTFSRTPLDLKQGMPMTLIKRWIVEEQMIFNINSLQPSIDNLKKSLGAGRQTSGALGVGGSMNIDEWAVMYRHVTQSGHTIFIDIYRATREGDFSWTFGNDFHEVPMSFRAMETSTNWAGTSLNDDEKLFRIRRQTS